MFFSIYDNFGGLSAFYLKVEIIIMVIIVSIVSNVSYVNSYSAQEI